MKLYVVEDCIEGYPEEIYYSFDEEDAVSGANAFWESLDEESRTNRRIRVYAYNVSDAFNGENPEEVYWNFSAETALKCELVLRLGGNSNIY